MNKEAIYSFVKKINTAKTEKEITDLINQGLLETTQAKAAWIGLANWETNKIEINRIKGTDLYKKDKELIAQLKKIRQIMSDFYNNVEINDLYDYMIFLSKDDKIIKPIIYRNNTLGYIGLVGNDKNFYRDNSDTVNILIEYINSKLEIM